MVTKFWKRFELECVRKLKKPTVVARDLGLTCGTVTGWKNGSIPQPDNLEKIAKYFGCSTDYLVGDSESRINDDAGLLSPPEKLLIKLFREATEKGRFEIIATATSVEKEDCTD